jgi:hypothetical protein
LCGGVAGVMVMLLGVMVVLLGPIKHMKWPKFVGVLTPWFYGVKMDAKGFLL